jgi:hypothetical protein
MARRSVVLAGARVRELSRPARNGARYLVLRGPELLFVTVDLGSALKASPGTGAAARTTKCCWFNSTASVMGKALRAANFVGGS